MMQQKNQPGYTLVLALMVIAMIVALVTMMAHKSSVHMRYMRTMNNRERAKALALSGVQIAMSQLAHAEKDPKKKEEKKELSPDKKQPQKQDPQDGVRRFLISMLPRLNTWQTFVLTQKNDGIQGRIAVCISCEDGKLDINQFFDFAQKKFVGEGSGKDDGKKIMQAVFNRLKEVQGSESLFAGFEKFLKERQNKLHEPSELLAIKEFERFKDAIFFEPEPSGQQKSGQEKQNVYLQDLFTIWSSKKELNPWLLSHSFRVVCGLKPALQSEDVQGKKLEDKLKEFKQPLNFPKGWDTFLAPLFGKKFEQLPKELQGIMSTKFEPRVFSVLSYGTVDDVTQKMLVIIERKEAPVAGPSGDTLFVFQAKRVYWL